MTVRIPLASLLAPPVKGTEAGCTLETALLPVFTLALMVLVPLDANVPYIDVALPEI